MELTSIKTSLDNGTLTRTTVTVACGVVYFSSTCERGSAVLEWATASETNSDHFVVERSMDGQAWVEMDRVSAAGNSQQVIEYRFVDPRPIGSSTSYYRLVQVDLDGGQAVLPTASIPPCASDQILNVFPNPTDGLLWVEVNAGSARVQMLELLLIDGTGRSVARFNASVEQGVTKMDLHAVASGSYTLQLRINNGSVLATARVVKR